MIRASAISYFTFLLLQFSNPAFLFAQEIATASEDNPFQNISASADRLRASVADAQSVTEDEKNKINSLLQSIESGRSRHEQAIVAAKRDNEAATQAQSESLQAREEIDKLQESGKSELPMSSSDLEQLTTAAGKLREEIPKLQEALSAIELRMSSRNSSRQSLITNIDQHGERIAKTKEEIASLTANDSVLLSTATKLDLQAKSLALEAERSAFVAQQRLIEAEEAANLLRNLKDMTSLKLNRAKSTLEQVEKAIADLQLRNAKKMAEAAKSQQSSIASTYPELSASYEENTRLADRAQKLEGEIQRASAKQEKLKSRLTLLEDMRRATENRVDNLGLTKAVGALLRKQKADLSTQLPTRLEVENVKSTLSEIEFAWFEIEEQRSNTSFQSILDEIEVGESEKIPDRRLEELQKPINDLVVARKEKLSAVIDGLNRQFEELIDIQTTEAKLTKKTQSYRDYINERILWIRSNQPLFTELSVDDSDKDVLKPDLWIGVFGKFQQLVGQNLLAAIVATILICLLFFSKPKLREEIDRLGIEAAKGSCESSWPTIHAISLSLVLGLSAPLLPLIAGAGIYVSSPTDNSLFDSLGNALLATAFFAIPMEILRRMCRKNGVAKCHFYWPNSTIDRLRKHLDWMILPSAALVFSIVLLHSLDATHGVDLIERVLFVAAMSLLGYFLFLTFSPTNGIFSAYLSKHQQSWLNQTSSLWIGFLLLIPTSLAVLAILGYYYSALNLVVCIYATFVFGLTAEIFRAFIRRLILLSRRRVHIQNARKKRAIQIEKQKEALKARKEAEAILAKAKADPDSEIAPDSLLIPSNVEIPSVESLVELRPTDDIDDNALRARKLVALVMIVVWVFGLWVIWSDVLPALKKLDSITLWSTETNILSDEKPAAVVGVDAGQNGEESAASTANRISSDNKNVSVRDLLKFIAIALLTLVSARHLPGAIEMLFLDHLPVDKSFRYATKALTSYAIVMLGMILAFNALSITWNNIQWLATALTFGLAFGLQEIFANFVAGIILMFERPIRIGDWVTVDDHTGVVSRIRTRATTIVNWDRKEYIIPNRDFITGRLINWTLSDAINRIVFSVGVAYGSDVVRAKKILLEVCANHPKTIADPPTTVAFDLFGDSSLNLTIRTFLSEVESRLAVTDDLHTQINQAFADAGIEISFPQRDLHIRSVDPAASDSIQQVLTSEASSEQNL